MAVHNLSNDRMVFYLMKSKKLLYSTTGDIRHTTIRLQPNEIEIIQLYRCYTINLTKHDDEGWSYSSSIQYEHQKKSHL